MNLKTLTSGLISSKYGIRPALMCATRKDLAEHSVVRILSDKSSGWIGISFGKVITGAKCQIGADTLNGTEALCELLSQESGHFDLIQLDSRLLGQDLAQSIGVSIDQLLEELKMDQGVPMPEIVQRCKKDWESLELLTSKLEQGNAKPAATAAASSSADEDDDDELFDDSEWNLDDEENINRIRENQQQWGEDSRTAAPSGDFQSGSESNTEHEQAEPPDSLVKSLMEANVSQHASLLAESLSQQIDRLDSLSKAKHSDQPSQPEAIVDRSDNFDPGDSTADNSNRAESNFILPGDESFPEVSLPAVISVEPKPLSIDERNDERVIHLPGPTDQTKDKAKGNRRLPPASVRKTRTTGHHELSSLRDEMRQELNDFVQAKLNLSSRVFQEVDLQGMNNYQTSIVLQDLENALNQAQKLGEDHLSTSGTFRRITEVKAHRLDLIKPETNYSLTDQSSSSSFAAETLTGAIGSAGLADKFASQIESPKTPKGRKTGSFNLPGQDNAAKEQSSPVTDQAASIASRDIFTEQVRKNTEVDPAAFLATDSNKDTELELKILKQKHFRNAIVLGASTCLLGVFLMTLIATVSRQASMQEASDKITHGDLKGAKAEYEKIIKREPSNWMAYMGHATSMPTEPEKRIVDYQKILELKPDELPAAMGIAKAYYELDRLGKAIDASDKAATIDPASPEPYKLKAQILMKMHRFAAAAECFKKAIALDKRNSAELSFLLSNCYKHMKQPKDQLVYLNKAIEESPANALYLQTRAALKIAANDYKSAKQDIDKALKKNSGLGELHYLSGRVLVRDNNIDKALEEFTRAINLGYATADSYGQRGMVYYSKRMFGEAKVDLEEAVKSHPDDKIYQRTLARTEAAIEAVKSSAGKRYLTDPAQEDSVSIANLKGNLVEIGYDLIRKGKYGSATTVLTAAVRQNPNDPHARKLLAHAFYLSGDYVSASTEFANAARLQSLSVDDAYLYGRSLNKATRFEQAIDVLNNLVEARPDLVKARVELIKAYSMSGFSTHAREQCAEGMRLAKNPSEYNQFKSLIP